MIYKKDGMPYQVSGSLNQFQPTGPRQDLFNKWDAEVIQSFGSPVYYHEVFINFSSIDKLYYESRDKIWSQYPVELFSTYEPVASLNTIGVFGIDAPDEIAFDLNYQDVLNRLGHAPKIGSRIFTPHRRENWVIIQRNAGEFKYWGQLRIQLVCQKWQESLTTGEGKVSSQDPMDFDVNPSNHLEC